MKFFYSTFIFLSLSQIAFALSEVHEQKLVGKKEITYEDLTHENEGCPENSECSPMAGKKMKQWDDLLKSLSKRPNIVAMKLEQFREQSGIPIMFLMKDDKQQKLHIDPIVWDSHCNQHNPKEAMKIVKGVQFYRNNPHSDKIKFVTVKRDKNQSYEIPYEDQPLLIYNNNIVIIRDYENVFYLFSISQDGKWKIINLPADIIKRGRIHRESAECKNKKGADEYFLGSFCNKIWNEDTKETEIIEQDWACP